MMKFAKGVVLAAMLATAATPAFADAPTDKQIYTSFLDYIKAQFGYEGAVNGAFSELYAKGLISSDAMTKLTNSFASLNTAYLNLSDTLKAKISSS